MGLREDYGPQAYATRQIKSNTAPNNKVTPPLAKVTIPTATTADVIPQKPKAKGPKGTLKWRASNKTRYNTYQADLMRQRRRQARGRKA